MVAEVSPTTYAINIKTLSDTIDRLFRKRESTLEIDVVEKTIVKVEGADAGRVILEMRQGPQRMRRLMYVLPGRGNTAILSFISPPENFSIIVADGDGAAKATQGVLAPADHVPSGSGVEGLQPMVLGVGLLLLGLLGTSLRSRRDRVRKSATRK